MNYRKDNPLDRSLSAALPARHREPKHHMALHHSKVAGAVDAIRNTKALEVTKLLCEFIALTAVRSTEARGAKSSEINLENAIWTIPAERMKRAKPFLVPLSRRAIAVFNQAREIGRNDGIVFPGNAKEGLLSVSTLTSLLKAHGIKTVTHGFRSSFSEWCAETEVNIEVAEHCLAHRIPDMTRRAYVRSESFKKRCVVMEDWARYLFPNGI